MLYADALILSCLPLSMSFIIVLLFFSHSTNFIYGQLQNETIGVNITSPERGKTIPISSNLTISGKSTDSPAADDCNIAVIVNAIRPYQPATANGSTGGPDDYSGWFFVLNPNYTSLKEGENEITAKLTCLPGNMTKWYSVNVTGVTLTQDTSTLNTTAQSQIGIPEQEEQQMILSPSTPNPEGLPTGDLFIQDSLEGGNEPDIIEGSISADNIDGENGDDRIQGNGGDDTISGGNGDDYLQADQGNDMLSGDNGDDILFGGKGDDIMDGGNGADNFSCGGGADTIADFSTFQGDVKSDDCEIY
jgi:RTX calcium-binding nonapeptide repeat (4 copies)